MTTNELLARVQIAATMSEITQEKILDYLSELQNNLSESPLDAAAYAGTARCREMIGGDAKTILDYYVLSLTLDSQDQNVWSMLGDFAARQAGSDKKRDEPPALPIVTTEKTAPPVAVFQAGEKIGDIIACLNIKGNKKLLFFLGGCLLLTYIVIFRAVLP